MTIADVDFWMAIGVIVAVIALVAFYRGRFHDRARGRRRCRKCWYDLTVLTEHDLVRCPECGWQPRRIRQLRRTRRHWRWIGAGMVLAVVAAACVTHSRVRHDPYGWAQLTPNSVVVFGLPWLDEGHVVAEVYEARRAGRPPQETLWSWQRAIAARQATRVLAEARGGGREAYALRWLVALGPDATCAVPEIVRRLEARSPTTALDSEWLTILENVGADAAPAAAALAVHLVQRSPTTRVRIGDLLIGLGPRAAPALPEVRSIHESAAGVRIRTLRRVRTARVLGAMGAEAHSALPALFVSALDDHLTLRGASLHAIMAIARTAGDVEPLVLQLLAHPDARQRDVALRLVDQYEVDESVVFTTLRARLNADDPSARLGAIRAVVTLGRRAQPLRDAVEAATRDPNPTVQLVAHAARAAVDGEPRPAIHGADELDAGAVLGSSQLWAGAEMADASFVVAPSRRLRAEVERSSSVNALVLRMIDIATGLTIWAHAFETDNQTTRRLWLNDGGWCVHAPTGAVHDPISGRRFTWSFPFDRYPVDRGHESESDFVLHAMVAFAGRTCFVAQFGDGRCAAMDIESGQWVHAPSPFLSALRHRINGDALRRVGARAGVGGQRMRAPLDDRSGRLIVARAAADPHREWADLFTRLCSAPDAVEVSDSTRHIAEETSQQIIAALRQILSPLDGSGGSEADVVSGDREETGTVAVTSYPTRQLADLALRRLTGVGSGAELVSVRLSLEPDFRDLVLERREDGERLRVARTIEVGAPLITTMVSMGAPDLFADRIEFHIDTPEPSTIVLGFDDANVTSIDIVEPPTWEVAPDGETMGDPMIRRILEGGGMLWFDLDSFLLMYNSTVVPKYID